MDKLLVSIFWFTIFGLFHSITAQDFFKKWLAQVTSEFFVHHCWRMVYVVVSFFLLFKIPQFYVPPASALTLFNYSEGVWDALAVLRWLGFIVLYWAIIQVGFFEFFGVRQFSDGIERLFKNSTSNAIPADSYDKLEVRGIFRVCRHPMHIGGLMMTLTLPPVATNVFFFILHLTYVLVGSYFEEKRLIANFGPDYLKYKSEVGAFWPNQDQYKRLWFFLKTKIAT